MTDRDDWWEEKERIAAGKAPKARPELEPIHMPKNSSIPFIQAVCWFTVGFGLVFHWLWIAIPGFIGIAVTMLAHSLNYDTDYYIPVDEIKRTEAEAGRVV